ncbi:MAG: cell wall hydrolase [Bacillota bacterium]
MQRIILLLLILTVLVSYLPVKVEATQSINVYTVQTGDTLWGIAHKFHTSVEALQRLNRMQVTVIYPRQELLLPQRINRQLRANKITAVVQAKLMKNELDWLARIISAEARGESLEGQIAIAAVVLNRAESGLFPDTIKEVIFQNLGGNYQFSPVANGMIYKRPVASAYRAAELAISGYDPTRGALFFYNPRLTSLKNRIRQRHVLKIIGNHAFAI